VRAFTSVLPIRREIPLSREFLAYIGWLAYRAEIVLVDGSPAELFAVTHSLCPVGVVHMRPDWDLLRLSNGKVAGVLTGVRRATHEDIVVADDDVRYDDAALRAVVAALDTADVVLPQNHFDPLPWHAWLDTGRTLVNRATGGDWPGTLAVRRSTLIRAHGYDGDVMFENLELVRTVVAAGGRAVRLDDVYVRRLPPSTAHFWSGRVRQAYDELARPARLAFWLSLLPAAIVLAATAHASWIVAAAAATALVAECGRRRAGGWRVFGPGTSLAAPVWIVERAICAWIAVFARTFRGGIAYGGARIRRAATPLRVLRRRFGRQLVS
jgi:hypothetical protein